MCDLIVASDPAECQPINLLAARGLSWRVHESTHEFGGWLDVVVTRDDFPVPTVDVIDVGPPAALLVDVHGSSAAGLYNLSASSMA